MRADLLVPLVLCVVYVPVVEASAADLFVSPEGDDAGPGTKERPWRTIQHAADSAAPGDTIHIGAGSYNQGVSLARSGSPDQPITFLGAPNHASVLDGTDLRRVGGLFEVRGQSHIVIDGLKVANAPAVGILMHTAGHVSVRNCHVVDARESGIMAWTGTDIVIEHNEVERACQTGEETVTVKFDCERVQVCHNHIHHTGHEGIDVKEGSRHVRVYGNHLHHVERQALYADAWDRETYDIEFFDNVVHNCMFGLAMCAESNGLLRDVRAYSNVIYDCVGPGLVVADWGQRQHTHEIRHVSFEHNTIHKCGSKWGGGMLIENTEADGVAVRYNIFSATGSPYILINRLPRTLIVDRNLGYGSKGFLGENAVEGDPLFVNPEEGDFRLRLGSPALSEGDAPNLGATPVAHQRDTEHTEKNGGEGGG